MNDYATMACESCRQAVYLDRRKLKDGFWSCPSCGAENMALGTMNPNVVALPPSRFRRPEGEESAAVARFRRHHKLPLIGRLAKRGRSG
jgi:NAD-dependent SIR2 family protein deacetylase